VVSRVARSAAGAPFAAPVDARRAPGYALVVAQPMDLGAVAARLRAGAYASPGAARPPPCPVRVRSTGRWARWAGWCSHGPPLVPAPGAAAADVALVWGNARAYNQDGSDILALCNAAEAAFCRGWAAAGLPPAGAPQPGPPGGRGAGRGGGAPAPPAEPEQAAPRAKLRLGRKGARRR